MFEPANNPIPRKLDGGLDWTGVTGLPQELWLGRLQHEKRLPFDHCNDLKRHLECVFDNVALPHIDIGGKMQNAILWDTILRELLPQ